MGAARLCRLSFRTTLVVLLLVLPALHTAAQDTAPPDADARIRFGPLALRPTFALANMGIDDNVFDEPDQQQPKSDFTFTLTPASDMWLHVGRGWVTGRVQEDLVYYQTYSNQRSANQLYRIGVALPFNRLSVNANATRARTRERPGFEIDSRPWRSETGLDGAVEFRVLSKTSVGVRAERRSVRYDQNQFFDHVDLDAALTGTTSTQAVTARHALTPLTSLVFEAGREQDRFDLQPLRNSDSTRVSGGVQFDPFALISGTARFGYRRFDPADPTTLPYSGPTASVDLSYVAFGTTKLAMQAARDVNYSYSLDAPYYVQTGLQGSVQQQVYGPIDVTARGGAASLAYRTRISAAEPNRTDQVRFYGAGVGYRVARDIRVAVTADRQLRTSALPDRQYHRLRWGVSVTYGL